MWGLALAFALLLACAGGTSRTDSSLLPALRGMSVIVLLAVLASLGETARRDLRPFAVFGLALVAVMVVQLVPLPPALWQALPGRAMIVTGDRLIGLPAIWRPISLTPAGTFDDALALLPVLAALAICGLLGRDRTTWLVYGLGALILFTCLMGVLQSAAGQGSALRFYSLTNEDSAVGLFANRNHQAALLACGLPVAAWLAFHDPKLRMTTGARYAAFAFATVLIALMLLTAGSRAGLVLGLASAVISIAVIVPRRAGGRRMLVAGAVAGVALLGAALSLGAQFASIRRLVALPGHELRLETFGDTLGLLVRYFPVGSGFGSFAAVYQIAERDALLSPNYLNAAHNDLLQIGVEGGVPAYLLLGAVLFWWGRTVLALFRHGPSPRRDLGRAGFVVTVILFAASLTDYPLRTPLLGAVFVGGCWMMAMGARRHRPR